MWENVSLLGCKFVVLVAVNLDSSLLFAVTLLKHILQGEENPSSCSWHSHPMFFHSLVDGFAMEAFSLSFIQCFLLATYLRPPAFAWQEKQHSERELEVESNRFWNGCIRNACSHIKWKAIFSFPTGLLIMKEELI